MRKPYQSHPWLRFLTKDDNPGDLDTLVNDIATGGSSNDEKDEGDLEDSGEGESPSNDSEDEEDPKESQGDPKEDEEGGSEDTEDEEGSWEELFPDSSPDEVAQQLDVWKKRSRKWERQSKENLTELKKLQDQATDSTHADEYKSEVHMYRDVIAHATTSGNVHSLPTLLDSLTFREAYKGLDRSGDDFEEQLSKLIEKRVGKSDRRDTTHQIRGAGSGAGGGETYRDHAKAIGDELFEEIYGTEN